MPLDVTFHEPPQGAQGEVAAGAEVPVEQAPAKDEITVKIEALTALKRDPKTGKSNEKDSPYWNKDHPDHAAVVEEAQQLYRLQEAKREAENPEEVNSDGTPMKPESEPVPGIAEETQVEFREIMRGLGADDAYTRSLVQDYSKLGPRSYTVEEAVSALTAKYGDQTDSKIQAAVWLVQEAGMQDFLEQAGLANDPRIVEWCAARAEEIFAARAEIDQINADPTHPYFHPENGKAHKEALEEMQKLFAIAHPGTRQ